MGVFTIATYKLHDDHNTPENHEALRRLIASHHMTLKVEGLATSRPAQLLHAEDGTFLELFEWVSETAAQAAHSNDRVQKLWGEMGKIATFPALAEVKGCDRPFPHFSPVRL